MLAALAALPLMACDGSDQQTYQGYVEGDYMRVAALEGGTLAAIPVQRGDSVTDGALLFQLDQTAETAAHEQAAAQLAQARAQFDDLSKGLRPTELDAIKASRASAAATLKKTDNDLARAQRLFKDGHISKSALDGATANRDSAAAALRELNARLATGELAARSDQLAAAEAAVKAAEAALAQADWRLAQREGHAPAAAFVEDVFFRVGETAAPGQAVVSLLPPGNIKLRFFIAEGKLGGVHVGDKVSLACDGCAGNLTGTVRYISSQAEFTPPVIYSEDEKSKLVYMAEAVPDANPEAFHPGQPVRVTLAHADE
jgi:HlyD family secretion protein